MVSQILPDGRFDAGGGFGITYCTLHADSQSRTVSEGNANVPGFPRHGTGWTKKKKKHEHNCFSRFHHLSSITEKHRIQPMYRGQQPTQARRPRTRQTNIISMVHVVLRMEQARGTYGLVSLGVNNLARQQ